MSVTYAGIGIVYVTKKIIPKWIVSNMEDKNQNEVEALCPECGHAFKKFVDRVIQSGQKLPEKHDIECPVCGCGECHIVP